MTDAARAPIRHGIHPGSDRVRVHRAPERAAYDLQTVGTILDAGLMCHLGYVVEGQPYVVPTLYGRDGDALVVHGSSASRALRTGARMPVCVTVTLLDGVILARSLFNHSANYRSVVVIGQAEAITDQEEKEAALRVLTEHLLPGRWDEARAPNDKEMRATAVLRLDLTECSAKVRTGPPEDDEEDLGLAVWAGEIPLEMTAGRPVPDPYLAAGIDVPPSVTGWVPDQRRHRTRSAPSP